MRRLMAITDRRQMGPDPLALAAELARALGPRVIIQLREKDLSPRALLEALRWLAPRVADAGATLVINGRVDVALCVPGVGVHLPEDALPVAVTSGLLGARLLGASAHEPRAAVSKGLAGAALVTLSPVFDTPSKRGVLAPLGPGAVREAVAGLRAAGSSAEVFGLGGLTPAHAAAVWAAGAGGVAAIRAAWDGSARALLEA